MSSALSTFKRLVLKEVENAFRRHGGGSSSGLWHFLFPFSSDPVDDRPVYPTCRWRLRGIAAHIVEVDSEERRTPIQGRKERRHDGVAPLTISDRELKEESSGGSQTTRLEAIEKIAETREQAYIYVSAITAHVIPRDRVSKGDVDSFLAALRGVIGENVTV